MLKPRCFLETKPVISMIVDGKIYGNNLTSGIRIMKIKIISIKIFLVGNLNNGILKIL